MRHSFATIERRWQKIWKEKELYKTRDKVRGRKNFYCLDMFPYPSGEGLHVGHLHGYIASDVISRYYRMRGFNVLHPMGFDAFGLPAENAAIKFGIHPKTWTYRNIKNITRQLKSLGAMYDWSREIITSEPSYYKWTQWLFIQLYKAGLAYRKKVPANWCPQCKTILANEQVIEGKCERCDSEVFQREIDQWLFKITSYTEDLLRGLESLDWPEQTKLMQKNWIGQSEGWEIQFLIEDSSLKVSVFTTRSDTLFGATYLVLAPEHKIILSLKPQNIKAVRAYIEESRKKTERERISQKKEKTGVELKGIKAINPANGRKIPIFVADYVLASYATGAVMAVPAHDQRDWDFAKKYNLPIIEVIRPAERSLASFEKAYEEDGILINSGRFNGISSQVAKNRIGEWLAKRGLAKKAVYYKLRDWIVSRQRYWGAPIPMVYCQKCQWVPVSEKDLPVLLPRLRDFKPTEKGQSPLAKVSSFVNTDCPKCHGPARRETDTMDTFVCSSWYYLRFTDPNNEKSFAAKSKTKSWLPVDIYVGGSEHSVGHLLYARFITKFLRDKGYLTLDEPFLKLRHPGIILGPDGQKMSKSRGNVITPESVSKKYGIDTLRIYEMFMGPFSDSMPWSTRGIEGSYRFLQKVVKLASKAGNKSKIQNPKLEKLLHKTIKKVSEDIENFRFNTAISALMVLVNEMQKYPQIPDTSYKILLKLLAPFVPHLAEELWQSTIVKFKIQNSKFKSSIHLQTWPKYDPRLAKEEFITLILQVNGKVRDKISVEPGLSEKKAKEIAISSPKIKKWIEGKPIKKLVFVPNKLVNVVV